MSKITEEELEEKRRMVEEEFYDNPALQQAHIARKITVREAKLEGLSRINCIKLLENELRMCNKGTVYNR